MVSPPYETPGYAQAGFLRAVADHLDRWDLAVVDIASDYSGGWRLHVIQHAGREVSAGLVGWARSLGAATLGVRALPDQVNVSFGATLGDRRVRVWGCVDGLREAMGLNPYTDATITVGGLAHFAEHATGPPAEHGTVPGPGVG